MTDKSKKVKEILEKLRNAELHFDSTKPSYPLGNQVDQALSQLSTLDKPSKRRIGKTEYWCEHKDKNVIGDDCVWCYLTIAETGMKKQRELRLKAEKSTLEKIDEGKLRNIIEDKEEEWKNFGKPVDTAFFLAKALLQRKSEWIK